MNSRSRNRLRGSVVAAVLLMAVAVVVIIVQRSGKPTAPDPSPSSVTLTDGWARATTDSPQPTISAVYGLLTNPGPTDRILVAATASAATNLRLQRFTGSSGVPQFEPVTGLTVPAGGTATLAPDGVRLLLLGAAAIEPGSTVYLQLQFDDGSVLDTAVPARVFEEVDLEGGWWHGDHFHPAGDNSHGPPPTD